jgi:hypothetical protein
MSHPEDIEGRQPGERVAERPHNWTMWWSVGAIIISLVSATISFLSLQESRTATNIAKARSAPLIYSTEASIAGKKIVAKKVLYVAVRLQNWGELPAQDISTNYNLSLVASTQKLVNSQAGEGFYKEAILAAKDWTEIHYRRDEPLTQKQVDQIMNGSLVMFYYGTTKYDHPEKVLSWCWKFNRELNEFWRCDEEE